MIGALNLNPSCVKTLSAVEALPSSSNQHELNGVSQLKSILGLEKRTFTVKFSLRGRDGYVESLVTWYDARENHASRSEYRLYFQTNTVMNMARQGSTLVFGIDSDNQFWAELIL
ncbi:type II restriction endonuclease [Providencia alcalifaciens]|uniref:type II restriction endonuclease n=1 Tax=Providencia alcalifaciens TaxID=126385 RepID=UPI0032D9E812